MHRPSIDLTNSWGHQVMGTGWTALRLQRFGIWNEDVCARFPQTVKVRQMLLDGYVCFG